MNRAAKAGAAYFIGMFALGFMLGTVRVLLIAPLVGAWGATLAELPVMLAASWYYCSWLVRRFSVPARRSARLLMGAIAFAMLMIAEVMLGTGLLARTLAGQVREMTSGSGLAGLLGQVAFAAFPWVQLRLGTRN